MIIILSSVLAAGFFLCLFLQIGANCVSNGKKLGVTNYCNSLSFNCGEYEIRTRDLLHAMRILLVFIVFHSFSCRFRQHLPGNFLFHIFA